MQRLFEEHAVRKTQSLDGIWHFQADPQDQGQADQWFLGLPQGQTVSVPSVWNTQLDLLTYEGAAWYEKKFYTEGGCLNFHFGAVMTAADIWLDGVYLRSHYGGFCQFEQIVKDVAPGWHTLTVRADNRFDEHAIPMPKVDWYHYGGITRSVSVDTLVGISVLYNRLEYTLSEDLKTARAHFVLELFNATEKTASSPVSAYLDGRQVYRETVQLDAGETRTVTSPEFTLSDIRLWHVGKPELYDILITTDTDDLMDRTGFRKVEVLGQQVAINGKPIEIRGINRHEEHPDWGMAFPQGLMHRDLDIIENLGCNAIRGSHYPNSRIFVDMLDDRGITFWSEIPIWGNGFSEEALGDPIIVERGLQMHREMVHYYYNHPCIILWGMHNEIFSETQNAYEMSKLYYSFLKEHGGNRLVTFASHRPWNDICMEFCDIICINRYAGWYYSSWDAWQTDEVDRFRQRREELGLSHKPVIYSEFGCAAIYGHHTFDDLKWTEEYQAKMITNCLETFHADPMVAGFYIWQFSDIRTSEEMGLNRARSFNNKGLVNEYRRPKMAYFAVRDTYNRFIREEQQK